MDYRLFYEKISHPFRPYKKIVFYINQLLTLLFYILYPVCLLVAYFQHDLIKVIIFPGISFVLLSLIRKKIDKKRPYESWQIRPLIHKDTKGNTMPSRHVFSSVMISMCFVMVCPVAGYILLFLSFLEACIRVIAGVHYPSDVIVGYLIGVGCGLIMIYTPI